MWRDKRGIVLDSSLIEQVSGGGGVAAMHVVGGWVVSRNRLDASFSADDGHQNIPPVALAAVTTGCL